MDVWQIFQRVNPDRMVSSNKSLPVPHQGETVYAKVTAELQDALFSIKKGSNTFQATIVGEVEIGKEYKFHANMKQNGLELTVIKDPADLASPRTIKLPANKDTLVPIMQRVQHLIQEAGAKIPDSDMVEVVKTIGKYHGVQKEIAVELTNFLITQKPSLSLPSSLNLLTTSFLSSENTMSSLQKIAQILKEANLPHSETIKAQAIVDTLLQEASFSSREGAVKLIKNLIPLLGLDYEQGLAQKLRQHLTLSNLQSEQLKPILLELAHKVTNLENKADIAQLASRLTGFQLVSREEGLFHHLFIPIPIGLEKDAKEWFVQISSKEKNKDKLDPDYCRIVMLIDLPIFASTMIDVLVQQKILSVTIHHSYDRLETLMEKGLQSFKEKVATTGYTLSAFKVIAQEKDEDAMKLKYMENILSSAEEGVDIRI